MASGSSRPLLHQLSHTPFATDRWQMWPTRESNPGPHAYRADALTSWASRADTRVSHKFQIFPCRIYWKNSPKMNFKRRVGIEFITQGACAHTAGTEWNQQLVAKRSKTAWHTYNVASLLSARQDVQRMHSLANMAYSGSCKATTHF